jgi:signal transduction histidine kinase
MSANHHDFAHQERIMDALYRVTNLMAEITDLKQLLNSIMVESKNVVGVEASSLMLYDSNSDELYFEVALGEKGEQVKIIRLKMGQGIAGTCAKERRTIVVNDVSHDDRHYKKADKMSSFQTRNILATPMVRQDRLIGVLEILNKFNGQPFTETDVKVLEFFADHAAIAIENALLVEANVRAERLAALGQAVASISHYIKNILAGIKGSASLIDLALSTDNFPLVHESWPILQRSNAKIFSLTQDMLTYSKERQPELTRANLNNLADDTCRMVETGALDSGVRIETELAPDMPDSMFDVSRVHDAVLNIVSNAIDATHGQTEALVRIITQYDAAAKRISVAVADNGPGISEAVQKRIFEPFFSTKGSKGTGLGLAVAQKVVREHGGDLLLESREGAGAKFLIWLPFIEPKANSEG